MDLFNIRRVNMVHAPRTDPDGLLVFDLSGGVAQVVQRAVPAPRAAGPGRPKLGVVSRGVSLPPRHWARLQRQRGGASAVLRRLIDEAGKADPAGERQRLTTAAAGQFMTVMAGDLPGHEEASRALYGDAARLRALIAPWPDAVQTQLLYLLYPAFGHPGILPWT